MEQDLSELTIDSQIKLLKNAPDQGQTDNDQVDPNIPQPPNDPNWVPSDDD